MNAKSEYKIDDRVVMNALGAALYRNVGKNRGLKNRVTTETKATVVGFCRDPESFRLRLDGKDSTTIEAFSTKFWSRLETNSDSSNTSQGSRSKIPARSNL